MDLDMDENPAEGKEEDESLRMSIRYEYSTQAPSKSPPADSPAPQSAPMSDTQTRMHNLRKYLNASKLFSGNGVPPEVLQRVSEVNVDEGWIPGAPAGMQGQAHFSKLMKGEPYFQA